jgi:hypothetical protein
VTLASLDRTNEIRYRIETREARIGIIGMGYVGLPLALLFSEERFTVTGFDIDPRKVDTLNGGWIIHRAYPQHGNPIGPEKRFQRGCELQPDCPDGHCYHLCADSSK